MKISLQANYFKKYYKINIIYKKVNNLTFKN